MIGRLVRKNMKVAEREGFEPLKPNNTVRSVARVFWLLQVS